MESRLTRRITAVLVCTFCSMVVPSANSAADSVPLYCDASCSYRDRAADMVSRMTVWQKIDQLNNFAQGIPELGLYPQGHKEKYVYQLEGLHGAVYFWDMDKVKATVFPQVSTLGDSWDTELVRQVASAISDEARIYHNVYNEPLNYYAPTINLARDPRWGRNEETYSEDPYMLSRMGLAFVQGFQGSDPKYIKASTTIKHFAANNVEDDRMYSSSDVDLRSLYEYFLPAFKECVTKGNSRSVMSAYNALNGVPCTVSKFLLQDLLRGEWSFEGFVGSDANAVENLWKQHFTYADPVKACAEALNHGCDMCVGPDEYKNYLPGAYGRQLISEADLDQSARRIIETRYLYGDFDPKGSTPYDTLTDIDKTFESNKAVALKAAKEGLVLLKNENRFLPLNKDTVGSIAVIGPAGDENYFIGGYSNNNIQYKVSVKDALMRKGTNVKVTYSKGVNYDGSAADDMIDDAVNAAKASNVVVLCLGTDNSFSSEGKDAPSPTAPRLSADGGKQVNLDLPGRMGELARKVFAVNPKTILVLSYGNPLSVNWENANLPAILASGYGGQEYGNAVADALYGDYNPGGKLSRTFYKNTEQLPDIHDYNILNNRLYMYTNAEVLYPFGYGLSYTEFEYSGLNISKEKIQSYEDFKVSINVKNTGDVAGDEVVQVYLKDRTSSVKMPAKALKGFCRISLKPGESQTVTFTLNGMDGAYYNVDQKRFIVEPGVFEIQVGSSSQDIRQTGAIHIEWTEPAYDGYYKIVNKKTGLSLQVPDNFGINGDPVTQGSYYGYNCQKWTISQVGEGTFKLINRQTNKAMGVKGVENTGGTVGEPGTLLQESDYTGDENQHFLIAKTEDGYVNIKVLSGGKALSLAEGKTDEGAGVQLSEYAPDDDSQKWKLVKVYDNGGVVLPQVFYESKLVFTSVSNGKYLNTKNNNFSIKANSSTRGANEIFYMYNLPDDTVVLRGGFNTRYLAVGEDNVVYADKSSIDSSTSFFVIDLGNGNVAFKSKLNGKYLSIASGVLAACAEKIGSSETFRKEVLSKGDPLTTGYWKITNKKTGYALTAEDNTDGSAITTQYWNGSDKQQWSIKKAAGGYYCITSKSTEEENEALTVDDTSKDRNIWLWKYFENNDMQLWKLTSLSGGYYRLASKYDESGNKVMAVKDKNPGAKVCSNKWNPRDDNEQWQLSWVDDKGLTGQYFDDRKLDSLKVSRIDNNVDFNWGKKASPDPALKTNKFSARWSGKIYIPYSEPYTFHISSNGGTRLWIDGKLIIDNWSTAGLSGEKSGTVTGLMAGQAYDIRLEYYSVTGNAKVQLKWSCKSIKKEAIPRSAFSCGIE